MKKAWLQDQHSVKNTMINLGKVFYTYLAFTFVYLAFEINRFFLSESNEEYEAFRSLFFKKFVTVCLIINQIIIIPIKDKILKML